MLTRLILLAPVALTFIACAPAPPQGPSPAAATTRAQIPPWGLDLSARDPAVRPGDDFYRYADGHWLDTHKIPADRTRWGSFDELDERASAQVLQVVQGLPADAPQGSDAQKVGDYYRAFIDTATIDAKGIAPARAGLDAVSAARNHHDLTRLMGRADLALLAPLRLDVSVDQKDPDRYTVTISQSGLGLPNRDYYLKSEAVYAGMREKYRAHIARTLTLIGEPNPAEEAQAILEVGDAYRPRAVAGGQAARARPHLQPAHARPSSSSWFPGSTGRRCSPPPASTHNRSSSYANRTRCRPWGSCSSMCRPTPGARTSSTTTW